MTQTLELLNEHRCFNGWQRYYQHASQTIGLPMRFSVYMPPQLQASAQKGAASLAEAIGQVVNTGRADVFRELALDFKRKSAQATDMTAFHKAGFESRVDRDTGDILVRLGQGPWLPLSQLAKK